MVWHSPGHEDVDEAFVGVELGRDVVFDPLVDGLWRRVCFDLLQQLLLQLQQREQEAQTLPLQDLQHAVLVLINFWKQANEQTRMVRAPEGSGLLAQQRPGNYLEASSAC